MSSFFRKTTNVVKVESSGVISKQIDFFGIYTMLLSWEV